VSKTWSKKKLRISAKKRLKVLTKLTLIMEGDGITPSPNWARLLVAVIQGDGISVAGLTPVEIQILLAAFRPKHWFWFEVVDEEATKLNGAGYGVDPGSPPSAPIVSVSEMLNGVGGTDCPECSGKCDG